MPACRTAGKPASPARSRAASLRGVRLFAFGGYVGPCYTGGMTTSTTFEFDCPFTVHADGSVTDAPGVYAPEVYHSDDDDVEIHGVGWDALVGYTGQYGYHGAVMHASEQFAGGIREDVLAMPGTYVLTVVEVMPEDDDPEPEPAGWAVLRKD